MTNREKYIIKRNEYDMLMGIYDRTKGRICPLYVLSDIDMKNRLSRCALYHTTFGDRHGCAECVQAWLNEKEGNTGAIQHRV